ncbi:MAG: divalent-cation tolerance protein CutA [Candidatus Omnitrophica bacterium]|nr:divalent-cation tolerance protein CutA [Candidatus Omnitrophota bacterium]
MVIVVMVSIPQENAQDLAKALLSERVCACVNIIKGVDSFFWWKGKIDHSQEAILLIKTKDILYPKLKTFIQNNHPYEVPEIISFRIDQINKEYQDWLMNEANSQTYM